jgi:hypothetical protein
VVLIVIGMKREIADYCFLTGRAGNKSWIFSGFSWKYVVVSITAWLCFTRGPPKIIFCWCCAIMVVTIFVGCVEMCSICTWERQFGICKLRLAKLLQPVKSVII